MVSLALLLVQLLASAAQAEVSPEEPEYYSCMATVQGDFGHLWYTMNVPVDGSPLFHRIQWQTPRRPEGMRLTVQWDGQAPAGSGFEDRAWVSIGFATLRRISGRARIELRRTPGERYGGEFAYAGPFRRSYRLRPDPQRYIESSARWGELVAWMHGREALTVALVRRDGRVIAEERLEVATLAASEPAIAAARAQLAPMVADYRNRCAVPGPIILT